MNSILSTFKLSTAKRRSSNDPKSNRRDKVLMKLKEQVLLAQDENYKSDRKRKIRDGNLIELVTIKKTIKPCWFAVNDKIYVQIYYGNKVVALSTKSDKNAIEITNKSELIPTLNKLIEAVENCELDQQIEQISNLISKRFKK
jgi:hypothetical protein